MLYANKFLIHCISPNYFLREQLIKYIHNWTGSRADRVQ